MLLIFVLSLLVFRSRKTNPRDGRPHEKQLLRWQVFPKRQNIVPCTCLLCACRPVHVVATKRRSWLELRPSPPTPCSAVASWIAFRMQSMVIPAQLQPSVARKSCEARARLLARPLPQIISLGRACLQGFFSWSPYARHPLLERFASIIRMYPFCPDRSKSFALIGAHSSKTVFTTSYYSRRQTP